MRSRRAHFGAPSGPGHQRAARASDVGGLTAGDSAAAAANTTMPAARERQRWRTVAQRLQTAPAPDPVARSRYPCGSLDDGTGVRGPLVGQVPRQGNSDAVRLVSTLAAILSIGAGVIHVSAAGDHTSLPVMFAGFLAVATLQIALGALLLWRRPSKLLIAAGVGLMVGSIAVWVLSRTEGLPFLEDGHTEAIGFKDGITVLFELGSIPLLLLLMSQELDRVSLPSPRLASHALAVTGAGCFALMAPALLLGGGEHHSHDQAVKLGSTRRTTAKVSSSRMLRKKATTTASPARNQVPATPTRAATSRGAGTSTPASSSRAHRWARATSTPGVARPMTHRITTPTTTTGATTAVASTTVAATATRSTEATTVLDTATATTEAAARRTTPR